MANPLKLIKTVDNDTGVYNGGVQIMSVDDLDYTAKLVLEKFAVQSNTGVGDLYVSTSTGSDTLVGTYTDRYANGAVGDHPADETIYEDTYYFYQNQSSHTEGAINAPLQHETGGSLAVQSDDDLNGSIISRCLELLANTTNEEAGTYYLDTTAPISGTWVSKATVSNRPGTSASNTVIHLWRRTDFSKTVTNSVRPVYMPSPGTVQELTDTQIQQFADRLRNRIVSTGIGTYKLQTTDPSASGGTWVTRGQVVDTVYNITNVQYSRGQFTRQFSGNYTRTVEGDSYTALLYQRQYIRGQFSRTTSAQYTGQYTRVYSGQYSSQYTRVRPGPQYTGATGFNRLSAFTRVRPGPQYTARYARQYAAQYGRVYTRIAYSRGFTRVYSGNYVTLRPGPLYQGATGYTRVRPGPNYAAQYTRRYAANYSSRYQRTVVGSAYPRSRPGPQYTTVRPGPRYLGGPGYRLAYGVAYGNSYLRQYTAPYGVSYQRNFLGQYSGGYDVYNRLVPGPQYTVNYNRLRPGPFYTGNVFYSRIDFVSYTREFFYRTRFLRQYSSSYTRVYSGSYTRVFSGRYESNFVRRRPGPQYTGTAFTRIYSAQYFQSFQRQYTSVQYTRVRPGPQYAGANYVTLRPGPFYSGPQYTRARYSAVFARVYTGQYFQLYYPQFTRVYNGQYTSAQFTRFRPGPQYSGQYTRVVGGSQYTGLYAGPVYATQYGRFVRTFSGQYSGTYTGPQYTGQYTGATIQSSTTSVTKYLWLRVA